MAIPFISIPLDLLTVGQYMEVDPSMALSGLVGLHQRLLVIGQRLSTGETPALTPFRVTSVADAKRRCGRGSQLATMLAAAKAANAYTETWAVALDDDAAGAKASGKFTFTGTATEDGTVSLLIGGTRVRVGVTSGDTAAVVAGHAITAVNAVTDLPAVAAAGSSGETVINHRHKGAFGNYLDLRHSYYQGERIPAGLTLAVTAMSGGTANPDITPALAAVVGRRYHYTVQPYTDTANLTAVETWVKDCWGPLKKLRGKAFTAASGTSGALSTLGAARNSQHNSIFVLGQTPTPPEIMAAVYGAVEAYYLNIDPARPTQTLELKGVLPPAVKDILDTEERNVLLHDGLATGVVDDGGVVRIERDVTTYKTNALGEPDTSMRDVNTMVCSEYFMDQVEIRFSNRYPRHSLAEDTAVVQAGAAIVRPKDLRDEMVALYGAMERAGIVEDKEGFKKNLVMEINESDRTRVDGLLPPNFVNQFRVFAGLVQFRI